MRTAAETRAEQGTGFRFLFDPNILVGGMCNLFVYPVSPQEMLEHRLEYSHPCESF